MRIVAGIHRSRVLEAPRNNAIRPTSDKVRGALFNMLRSRGYIENAIVVDAFCGTGALGLEALSQGADFCTFIDKNRSSLDLAKRNVTALGEAHRSHIILADGAKLSCRPGTIPAATLVFLDPPYGKNLITPTLQSLIDQKWLAHDCICVAEESSPVIPPKNFTMIAEKRYGDTYITVMRYIQPL